MNGLSSWPASNQQDCCKWKGVHCNNHTGRVTQLFLGNTYHPQLDDCSFEGQGYPGHTLGGEISSSLLELEFLTYLNLSFNDFNGTQIPSFLGSIKSLTHLDLNHAGFSGLIPHQLGNLSNLHFLNLRSRYSLQADNLYWMSNLLPLKYLDLTYVYVRRYEHSSWLQVLSVLPSTITELHLRGCRLLSIMVPYHMYATVANFTSLRVLNLYSNQLNDELMRVLSNISTRLELLKLSSNFLQGEIPNAILNFQNLKELKLDDNEFIGQIPEFLGTLKNLEYLDLGYNSLTGPIPTSLANLSSLRVLDLGANKLNGTIPKSLRLITESVAISVWENSLEGPIEESFFFQALKIRGNFNVFYKFLPQCESKYLGSSIPTYIYCHGFLQNGSEISFMASIPKVSAGVMDIKFRNFRHGSKLSIANNSISGSISHFQCERMSIGLKLKVLDVSNNFLSGELGNCWTQWKSLSHLNLGRNNLFGEIPDSIGYLYKLESLHLNLNRFSGHIPSSLRNCSQLKLLDVGENKFSGTVPLWIWEMRRLQILRLRSNEFKGSLHQNICQLSHLIVLDLANNSLAGTIPKCLNKIKAMAIGDSPDDLGYDFDSESYEENLKLVPKGDELEYQKNLGLVRIIDLSVTDCVEQFLLRLQVLSV
ncbi:Leucine-rich repeat receptor protein kinase [Quillaja saponaria]|uniref:Leucine-rich repeat receptor protein kinase n=1 Tax=Quillaja saponaria TaxID=32244 RepID=A0AAD7PCG6_QUISA|nr:Leucine-rich repeat receptor protein kinase [Quillaja saponaria]